MKRKYGLDIKNIPSEVMKAIMSIEAYIGCAHVSPSASAKTVDEFIFLARSIYHLEGRNFPDPLTAIVETQSEIEFMTRKQRRACQQGWQASEPAKKISNLADNSELYKTPPLPKFSSTTQFAPTSKRVNFYKSWEWRSARMEILKERGAICECCGATPRSNDVNGNPVRICVDHIKPVVRYWHLRLDKANLQVLCDECNQGKGAWDETDWRGKTI